MPPPRRARLAPAPPTAEERPAPSAQEIADATRVLESLAADPARLSVLSPETRRALLVAAGRLSKPDRQAQKALAKSFRRQDKARDRAADEAVLESTGLRRQRAQPVFRPLWIEPGEEREEEETLRKERSCYICKAPYRQVHRFYDSMCVPCGEFNYAKRTQSVPLEGRVCLVTGARVKIGYQVGLMLLRAGAHVIATTRFPQDAALRYSREPDFERWRHRLSVHGLDLRHTPSVELFTRFLLETQTRLDLLVNNACQTVRRPSGWYAHLLPTEELPLDGLPEPARPLLGAHRALSERLIGQGDAAIGARPTPSAQAPLPARSSSAGLVASAALSQERFLDEDLLAGQALFPSGRLDADLQQVDLRETNSWRLTLAQVPTAELLEVQLVNAVAPFVLNARLKPLLVHENHDRDRHIINVSAMEGQFYRAKKTDRHPHTNMAKAALNMMTRTSAPDYARDGVWMNAVDTGWVTDEDPAPIAARKEAEGFRPPLDIVDGAARILDPFFVGLATGEHPLGQFFKDYRPAPW